MGEDYHYVPVEEEGNDENNRVSLLHVSKLANGFCFSIRFD